MEVTNTELDGVLLLQPRIFTDERGRFHETFNQRRFAEATGLDVSFVQDNESRSHRKVLRGLHFQVPPFAQGKLVSVVKGAVLDVCVDIRPHSPTVGRHIKVHLDANERTMLWIPPGFAHGFVALEDDTVFAYKCTAYYHPASERTIRWNDPELAIDWGVEHPVVSAKDAEGMPFTTYREAVQ
ncbi:MAG: dTDP-4-dehydrorhamnose 3,5-epimerase [Flavobacteriales bacterium]|nr:dTDP-4-dehydrorhamnose 3,5-epimerase [Flavobacteriales bacterium]MCB9179090.1 dTDP-4-dehydrorhamnose 3,5-epimerase [Flavobacteriales bacterium]